MRKTLNIIAFIFSLLHSFGQNSVTSYINPFIGTASGSTFPGATVPFGLVQLSPDTDSPVVLTPGYNYNQNTIVGFSHTHLSGVGVADLYDVLVMPYTGNVKWDSGSIENPSSGYRSTYSHEDESAKAGYYQVKLLDYEINAELTATEHAGFHRYTFNGSDSARVIIDLNHIAESQKRRWWPVKVIASQIRKVDACTVEGYRIITGWARMRKVYFYARFSQPIVGNLMNKMTLYPAGKYVFENQHVTNANTGVKAIFNFNVKKGEQLLIKVGISSVSCEGAKQNLDKEIANWNFEAIAKKAEDLWEKEVSNIRIEANEDVKKIFYTALYHCYIQPNNIADVNGDYTATDFTVKNASDKKHYSTFSLWDTYRAVHPLYTILKPSKNDSFINSMLRQYDTYGYLPIWQLWGNENYCMIGNHAIPVIVDAVLKGTSGINIEKAYRAVKGSSMQEHENSPFSMLDKYGYFPQDLQYESGSKTLEIAYNDWCVAQLAKKMSKTGDYEYFIKRAKSYRNIFDSNIGFFRGKNSDGKWTEPFDLFARSVVFTEANAWIYLWAVPQDIPSLIDLLGGKEKFAKKLDDFFTIPNVRKGPSIGQYWLPNEPSHHITYLYNYVEQAHKNQKLLSELIKYFNTTPSGIPGEDDCGQMSAWYIFNALGFYPANAANAIYDFGTPLINKATINLPNGKQFIITTKNLTEKNVYIQSIKLNGKKYNKHFLRHKDIIEGGTLEYTLGDKPIKN